MRPLELRLKHFGPYRDEAVLNFETLDRLFLICGPTGAGKTTLFDAMTFALYETTSGTRGKLADQLASHHATPGSVPQVTLKFALKDQLWRVTRQLRHLAPKTRGEGEKTVDSQVLLERWDGAWVAIPGKRSELNEKLEAMLGLSADEFSKIVVLPQGDFQQFLEATSGQRETMLSDLFPVDAYDRLTEHFKLQAKDIEAKRNALEDRFGQLSGQLQGADRASVEAALAEAQAALAEAETSLQTRRQELTALKTLRADWSVLLTRRAEIEALRTRAAEIDVLRQRLTNAARARPHAAALDRLERITADGKQARATQDDLKRRLTEEDARHQAWIKRRDGVEADQARLFDIQKRQGALEASLPAWKEAAALRASHAQAETTANQARRALDDAEAARKSVEAARPQAPATPNLEQALEAVQAATAARDAARLAETAAAKLADAETENQAAQAALDGAETARAEAERELALWNELLAQVQAAALAQSLHPGQPCPVCGAVDHPAPAHLPLTAAEAPDRQRRAAEALRETEAEAVRARERWQRAQVETQTLLGERPEAAMPVAEAEHALATAQASFEALRVWQKASADFETRLAEALKTEAALAARWTDADRERHGLASKLETLGTLASGDNPETALRALTEEAQGLRTRLDADSDERSRLETTRATLSARIEEAETQLTAQRKEWEELNTALTQALAPAGWTVADLRHHLMAETEVQTTQTAVQAFDRDRDRLEGEAASLEAKFPHGEPASEAPLAEAVETARAAHEQRSQAAKELEFRLRDLDRWEQEARELRRQTAELDTEFQIVVPLAKALDGGNAQKLRLKTYVLVQYLEHVARAATARLEGMSSGRYALTVQTRGTDSRSAWGLDLSVRDAFTGQERAVGTLSGGEKFMTSIALALGLADVIQERSGGLSLEAIFIDEGFGTLDDQSLDQAMRILQNLGHRSVGIISHVAELRQRIESRVEVVKGKNGSSLRLV